MIKELINFTKNLDEDFKNLAYRPSNGLHIMVDFNKDSQLEVVQYLYYNGEDDLNEDLSKFLILERYSSYISMNQQQKFDKKQKIHSASPFSFAFNFSLGSNKKDIQDRIKQEVEQELELNFNNKGLTNEQKNILSESLDRQVKNFKIAEVKKSIGNYFINAKKLCIVDSDEKLNSQIESFEAFCKSTLWVELQIMQMKKNISKKKDSEELKDVSILCELKEKDYIRVYLKSIPVELWKSSYEQYYQGEYPPQEFNTTDFISTYPDKKPFMSHQTATFETFEINGIDSNTLQQFKDILSVKPRVLPNPLPIFIYHDELQNDYIALFNRDRSLSYSEIITSLWSNHKQEFYNYYLINWYVAKDIVFQDFDFVSKFEYSFDAQIENLFEIKEKGKEKEGKKIIHYPKIKNVFELEQSVFKTLLQSKYLRLDYFADIEKKNYEHLDNTFQSYIKYRKAVYDFVYKSKRQGIDEYIFTDMVFSHIKDDLKQNNGFSIKEKLNIWFSLYERFQNENNQNKITMASKLKHYQDFVAKLSMGKLEDYNTTDKDFAFAAGQVIEHLLGKSQTQDKSYQLLEPYLQQAKCQEFKRAIANDIARYKHAIKDNETRFFSVCDFVLTYETTANMKELMPEILAGVFSRCHFFHKAETAKIPTQRN